MTLREDGKRIWDNEKVIGTEENIGYEKGYSEEKDEIHYLQCSFLRWLADMSDEDIDLFKKYNRNESLIIC